VDGVSFGLDREALATAIANEDPIEVIHLSDGEGDHRWRLNREETDRVLEWLSDSIQG
jgi:hypothetical protein